MITVGLNVMSGGEQWYVHEQAEFRSYWNHVDMYEETDGRRQSTFKSIDYSTDIDERRARIYVCTDDKNGVLFEVSGRDWRQKRSVALLHPGEYDVKVATMPDMPDSDEEIGAYVEGVKPKAVLPPFETMDGPGTEPVTIELIGLHCRAPFRRPPRRSPPVRIWKREECPVEDCYDIWFAGPDNRFVAKDRIFGWVGGVHGKGGSSVDSYRTFEDAAAGRNGIFAEEDD